MDFSCKAGHGESLAPLASFPSPAPPSSLLECLNDDGTLNDGKLHAFLSSSPQRCQRPVFLGAARGARRHNPPQSAMATASATGHHRQPYCTSVSRQVSNTRIRRREVRRCRNRDKRRRRRCVGRRIAAAVCGRAVCLRNEFATDNSSA
jgi:hypothetical protein